ncbi:Aspartic-type endopeptidase ctsD [Vanrija pseudolonga]|uniref:Aspartic-type endopeptidase ctsD n=1 Tax=Vanrija pseudolonga TaxID=143232 RepID=A0AAF1BRL7_9TREE|nr:Aspartic-type endopeptidase ctsD [Vanrija pseudolonga]
MKGFVAVLAVLAGIVAADPITLPIQRAVGQQHLAKRDGTAAAPVTAWGGDVVYTVKLDVGTPPQSFDFILDSTNNIIGLLEAPCATCPPGNPLFDSKKSTSWTAAPNNSLSGFGDLGTDVVALVNQSTKFGIGLINTLNTGFPIPPGVSVSGVLGLSPPPNDPKFPTPLLYDLAQKWTNKVYGIQLQRTRATVNDTVFSSQHVGGGSLTLGGVDASVITASINYTPALNLSGIVGIWAVPLDGINIGGSKVAAAQATPLIAFPDFSHEGLYAPHDVVAEFYSHVKGAIPIKNGGVQTTWVFPAGADTIAADAKGTQSTANLGLQFTIGGVSYAVADADLAIEVVTADVLTKNYGASASQAAAAAAWVIGSIQEVDPNAWVPGAPPGISLGNSFLRNVYTAFQFSPNAVGFGHLKTEAGAPVAPGASGAAGASGSGASAASSSAKPTPVPKSSGAAANRVSVALTLLATVATVVVA